MAENQQPFAGPGTTMSGGAGASRTVEVDSAGRRYVRLYLRDGVGPAPLPELKPMRPASDFRLDPYLPATVTFTDSNHLTRVIDFAERNNLLDKLMVNFAGLFRLMVQGSGLGEIWPDGQDTPSFGWRGGGLTGGLIFHESSRDWSIHT